MAISSTYDLSQSIVCGHPTSTSLFGEWVVTSSTYCITVYHILLYSILRGYNVSYNVSFNWLYYTPFYYTILCYSISYYNILYCTILYRNVRCCGVNADMATSFTCATHLQSRKSGYPIHCSFFRGDGHLLNLSQGVTIPSRFSFWRMGGHLLHVLYYSALYGIRQWYQVLQCIIQYYAI